jgi:hypothetical protein
MSEGLKKKIQNEIDDINDNIVGGLSSEAFSEGERSAYQNTLIWLDETAKQIDKIMCEDYWTSNFHLSKVREKILAVLGVDGKEKTKP